MIARNNPPSGFAMRQTKRAAWCLLAIVVASATTMLCFGHIALIGNFSSYQTIFGMIAKRYEANCFWNIWRPEFFPLESGSPILELIFFPLVSLLAAALRTIFGGNMDFWGRFVSVAATAATTLLVYRISRLNFSRAAAVSASFIFAFSPFVLVYGRNFQNEALALLFLSASLYGVMKTNNATILLLSAISLGVSGALRLHFLFVLPVLLLFFPKDTHWTTRAFWILASISIPLAWHMHNWHLQNTLPNVHSTMFMQLQMGKTFPHPLLVNPPYYLHVLKSIVGWTIGPVAFVFALTSIEMLGKQKVLRKWIALSVFSWATVVLIPDKIMAQHFYGYAATLPMSVLAGPALAYALQKMPLLTFGIAVPLMLLSSLAITSRPTHHVSPSDLNVFPAADFIRQSIPKDELVIASHGASGDLLYYGDHLGWPFSILPHKDRPLSVDMKIRIRGGPSQAKFDARNAAYRNSIDWLEYLHGQGARYFVVSSLQALEQNPALQEYLANRYTLISKPSDPFCAYHLQKKSMFMLFGRVG